jgi:hypothetical protein
MNQVQKYTVDVLSDAVKQSHSFAGVLRVLGLRQAGGTQSHLKRRVVHFGLDTSHFTGKGSNRGANHKGPRRLTPEEVLVKRGSGGRNQAVRLRRALVKSGVPYACATCGIGGEWCGKELHLQVNHKNRDWLDDRINNLEFLCPNCHSQTEGWCGSQGGTSLFSEAVQHQNRLRRQRANGVKAAATGLGPVVRKGRGGSSPSLRTKLSKGRPRKGFWPDKERLQELILTKPATEVAKLVGVSSVSVKKMAVRLGLKTRPRGYWAIVQANPQIIPVEVQFLSRAPITEALEGS